jgi:hypothetical protein
MDPALQVLKVWFLHNSVCWSEINAIKSTHELIHWACIFLCIRRRGSVNGRGVMVVILVLALIRVMALSYNCSRYGRAMTQAVSRRPPTAETRVRSWVSPCGICGGRSGTGTSFSPSTSVFPCQYYSTGAPLKWKSRKSLIIFLIGLHNKP